MGETLAKLVPISLSNPGLCGGSSCSFLFWPQFPAVPPAVCAVPRGSELSGWNRRARSVRAAPFRSADSSFEQRAPLCVLPKSRAKPQQPWLASWDAVPGSARGSIPVFLFIAFLFFFLPSEHGKSLLSSNVTKTAFALIKPQISSSKCLTRTDATGSCSLLPVPFPINLMAEPARAAGTSLVNKGALGAAAWSVLSVSGGLGGGGDPPRILWRGCRILTAS